LPPAVGFYLQKKKKTSVIYLSAAHDLQNVLEGILRGILMLSGHLSFDCGVRTPALADGASARTGVIFGNDWAKSGSKRDFYSQKSHLMLH